MTFDEAQYILNTPKLVLINGARQSSYTVLGDFPLQLRLHLALDDNDDFELVYEVNQSSKNSFKLTLYLMEGESKIGLLRIDYRGQHKNPEIANEYVPNFLLPYTGRWFDYEEHHIHYFVEGYKTSLDWAMPILENEFVPKQITEDQDIVQAFNSFNRMIHLTTSFNMHAAPRLPL